MYPRSPNLHLSDTCFHYVDDAAGKLFILKSLLKRHIFPPIYLFIGKMLFFCNSFILYLCRWFTRWQKYVGLDIGAYPFDEISPDHQPLILSNVADRPGPIDNTNIVSNGSNCEGDDLQLLRSLDEQRDYVLVSQEVWEKLFEWYIYLFFACSPTSVEVSGWNNLPCDAWISFSF